MSEGNDLLSLALQSIARDHAILLLRHLGLDDTNEELIDKAKQVYLDSIKQRAEQEDDDE